MPEQTSPITDFFVDASVYPLTVPYFLSKTLEVDNAGFDLRACDMTNLDTGMECKPVRGLNWGMRTLFESEELGSEHLHMEPLTPYIINTGIKASIPKGYYGDVCLRSSSKKRVAMPDHGTIDCNYRGHIKLVIFSYFPLYIQKYARVGQMKIVPYLKSYGFVDDPLSLLETSRGASGFGEYTA
jgi:dUTP pyrophosphatase